MRGFVAAVVWVAPLLTLAQTGPRFEVAVIKQAQMIPAADMQSGKVHIGVRVSASRVDIRLNSLRSLIRKAYGVEDGQIVAPESIGTPSWDIAAKMPEGAPANQLPEMLQALLAERFGLKVHREMRELLVYALIVAPDGPKLIASPPIAEGRTIAAPKGGFATDYMSGDSHIQATRSGNDRKVLLSGPDGNITITTVNDRTRIQGSGVTPERLTRALASLFFDRHMVNLTTLDGRYEIAIDLPPGVDEQAHRVEIRPDGQRPWRREALRPSEIRGSLEKMGLRIEARRAPVEMLVVDHAEKEPSAN
jgi:uncharacterized protein (TIGR03435 family)